MPVSTEQKPLLGKFRLTSTLLVETGLHIGGGGETLDIGGLDKPVIRDPLTRQPYLPGSSIKGKLRSILERLLNKPVNRESAKIYRYESDDLEDGYTEVEQGNSRLLIRYDGARNCQVSRLFGSTGTNCWIKTDVVESQGLDKVSNVQQRRIATANNNTSRIGRFLRDNDGEPSQGEIVEQYTKVKGRNAPARLIVRDCHLLTESAEKLKTIDTGLFMTEWKFENGIDRITAAATPRQFERVPAGSEFNFELVYTVEDASQAVEDLKNIAIAIAILEDDALGGHGSRGYGKVKFNKFEFFYRTREQYLQIASGDTSFLNPIQSVNNTSELLQNFGSLTREVQQLLPGRN